MNQYLYKEQGGLKMEGLPMNPFSLFTISNFIDIPSLLSSITKILKSSFLGIIFNQNYFKGNFCLISSASMTFQSIHICLHHVFPESAFNGYNFQWCFPFLAAFFSTCLHSCVVCHLLIMSLQRKDLNQNFFYPSSYHTNRFRRFTWKSWTSHKLNTGAKADKKYSQCIDSTKVSPWWRLKFFFWK